MNRDIEILRKVIQEGIPWLAPESHYEHTRNLTMEQRALLAHLTPFRSAAKFLADIQLPPEMISSAREALKIELAEAKARGGHEEE